MNVLNLRNICNERIWKKKTVQIHVDEDDGGSRNANYIQHMIQQRPLYLESKINAVTICSNKK